MMANSNSTNPKINDSELYKCNAILDESEQKLLRHHLQDQIYQVTVLLDRGFPHFIRTPNVTMKQVNAIIDYVKLIRESIDEWLYILGLFEKKIESS